MCRQTLKQKTEPPNTDDGGAGSQDKSSTTSSRKSKESVATQTPGRHAPPVKLNTVSSSYSGFLFLGGVLALSPWSNTRIVLLGIKAECLFYFLFSLRAAVESLGAGAKGEPRRRDPLDPQGLITIIITITGRIANFVWDDSRTNCSKL